MIGFFVSGTDTGVGKTHVACALAKYARSTGRRVFAFKPIETGCVNALGEDQAALVDAAGDWQRAELAGLWRLHRAVAPLVAAREEGVAIDLDRVAAVVRQGAREVDVIIVEGAGGWRVPLTDTADIAALAQRLALPIVIVARAGLGTINHSLLTLEAVERDGATVAALVLSRRPEDDRTFATENAAEISSRWPGRVLVYENDPSVLAPLLMPAT